MSKRNPYDKQRLAFINLLSQMRKDERITQVTLAEKLNKPQSFISKYENGERILDIVEIYQVCSAMDISFIKLMKEFNDKIKKCSFK